MKCFLKKIIPNFIKRIYSKINARKNLSWHGDYSSWKEAKRNCTGYESNDILEKVKNSLLKVKSGEYVYERDSVLFEKIEYSYPLLTVLLWVAGINNNKLNVIDFGGSLGSTYYQNKSFLDHLELLRWNIVEQENFVKCGKENFENEELKFYYSIDDCLNENDTKLILFSSVVQYLENPFDFLNEVVEKGVEFILFDRTSIINSNDHRLCVQTSIQYEKEDTYPVWLFNEEKFMDIFKKKYKLIFDFNAFVGDEYSIDKKTRFRDKGFFFQRI